MYFINVTYPRYLAIPQNAPTAGAADLLLELRVGRSGLGDDWLYTYTPNEGWTQVGRYLEVSTEIIHPYACFNQLVRASTVCRRPLGFRLRLRLIATLDNAYINGLDFDSQGTLHTTW